MFSSEKLSRQAWVGRCAHEIGLLVPLGSGDPGEALSPAFLNDWAAAVWTGCQGDEQPELAAWTAVKEAQAVWSGKARPLRTNREITWTSQ
jgi:hypothetical protein